jgi:hypothetical protein
MVSTDLPHLPNAYKGLHFPVDLWHRNTPLWEP